MPYYGKTRLNYTGFNLRGLRGERRRVKRNWEHLSLPFSLSHAYATLRSLAGGFLFSLRVSPAHNMHPRNYANYIAYRLSYRQTARLFSPVSVHPAACLSARNAGRRSHETAILCKSINGASTRSSTPPPPLPLEAVRYQPDIGW